MKRVFNNNILTVLVLASVGLVSSAQAATESNINITATVAEKLDISVDKDNVTLNETNNMSDDITITTSNNTPAKITVVANETGIDDHFTLKGNDNHTMDITTTITGDSKAKFDSETHTMTHELNGNTTILHLAAKKDANQTADTYTGSLLVKIEKL